MLLDLHNFQTEGTQELSDEIIRFQLQLVSSHDLLLLLMLMLLLLLIWLIQVKTNKQVMTAANVSARYLFKSAFTT